MNTTDLFLSLIKGGLSTTLLLFVLSTILAALIGFITGLVRLSRFRVLRFIATAYVEFFRGTSLLVQLFWIYYALPIFGLRIPPMEAGVLAIGLNYGAYCSEVVRSAILAVPVGQTEASVALNFSPQKRMTRIILPQALLIMIPSLGNQLIELLKSTSLVSLIALKDLTYQANVLNTSTFQTTTIYSLLLVIYFVISLPLTKGIRLLEEKLSAGRLSI